MPLFIIETEQQRERVSSLIAKLPLRHPLEVQVKEWRNTRTLKQNAMYWVLVSKIAQEMPSRMDGEWHDPEVWHEYFCRRYLGVQEAEICGEAMVVRRRSSKLNRGEFADFYLQVESWAAENGILLDNWQV